MRDRTDERRRVELAYSRVISVALCIAFTVGLTRMHLFAMALATLVLSRAVAVAVVQEQRRSIRRQRFA